MLNRRGLPPEPGLGPGSGSGATDGAHAIQRCVGLIPAVVDRNRWQRPPGHSSPACGGGRVGGRLRASGSGRRSPATVRHAERPSPNPSRRAGGEKTECPGHESCIARLGMRCANPAAPGERAFLRKRHLPACVMECHAMSWSPCGRRMGDGRFGHEVRPVSNVLPRSRGRPVGALSAWRAFPGLCPPPLPLARKRALTQPSPRGRGLSCGGGMSFLLRISFHPFRSSHRRPGRCGGTLIRALCAPPRPRPPARVSRRRGSRA